MALLSGTVVVISGVGPGLGRSIALASAREGADLVLAARTAARLDEVAKEVTALHRVLTADPRHQGLELWLAEVPQPRPPRETWAADPAFRYIQAGCERRHVSHPEFMAVHYMAAQASAGWSTTFRGEVIGRDQLETWAYGLDRFTEARARHDPARFYDIEYDDFVAKPMGTVEAVYHHFGLTLSGRAADAMRALCGQNSGTAGPGHHYALSDFGLTGEQVDERFAGYHRARA